MLKNCKHCGQPFDATKRMVVCPDCKIIQKRETARKWKRKKYKCNTYHGRFSNTIYENSPEKIAMLKEKYKNGVSEKMISDWIFSL